MLPALRAAVLALTVSASLTLVATAPVAVEAAGKPPKPVISKTTPNSGPTTGGTVVKIKGKNLGTATKVLFGTSRGTSLKVRSDKLLTVTAPPHAAGVVDLKVRTKGGKSAKSAVARFTYIAQKPEVAALSPSSGPDTGGTVVTVTGSGFVGVSAVTFDGIPGTAVSVASPTQLKVTSPAHQAFAVHVNVTTGAGTSPTKAADRFLYLASTPPAPTVTGVAPAQGPIAGGTSVTVTGTGLTGATGVTFGGAAGTALNAVSSTQLTVTSPAHAAGVVDVRVTTPGGTSAVGAGDTFTYQGGPAVSSGSMPPDADPDPGAFLAAVSCPAAQTCFAVGGYNVGFRRTPLVERRTGPNTWVGTSPALPSDADPTYDVELVDVDCASATFCVAVGTYLDDSVPTQLFRPLIETWNGSAWTPSTTLLPVADADYTQADLIEDVDCPTTTTCVAVGRYDTTTGDLVGLTLTLTGGSWASQAVPAFAAGSTSELYSVDCPSASSCVAAGEEASAAAVRTPLLATGPPGALAAAGSVGLPADKNTTDPQVELRHVSCASPTSCVAAGSYRTVEPDIQGFLEVLSAGTWAAVAAPAPAGAAPNPVVHFGGVSCSTTCAAVGDYRLPTSRVRPILVTVTGVTATVVAGAVPAGADPGLNASPATVTCAGAQRCLGVGFYEADPVTRAPLLSQLTGAGWVAAAGPSPADLQDSLQPIASTLDGSVVVSVGYYVDTNNNTVPLLLVDLPV